MIVLSRRALAWRLGGAVLGAGAARFGAWEIDSAAASTPARDRGPLPPGTPVVSFFLDQPYVDASGVGEPYVPPKGLRGGEALAQLSEIELRHIAPYG